MLHNNFKFNNSVIAIAFIFGIFLFLPSAFAEDKIITIESTITGSQEQPTILVIVPWHKTEAAKSIEESAIDETQNIFLQPIERKTFLKKNKQLESMISQPKKP